MNWIFTEELSFYVSILEMTEETNTQNSIFFAGENVIELAMYLDLLNSYWYPTWPVVFAAAERVLSTIRQSDPDFYNHLKMISRINVKVNPKVIT